MFITTCSLLQVIKMKNKFGMIDMLVSVGAVDILQELSRGKPKQFTDFTNMINQRTKNKFSPTTISMRLKELTSLGAIKPTIVNPQKGRRKIAYMITPKGKKMLEICFEFEKKLEEVCE